jgi:ubiquinone/menaquinone biosynthesis C-methylase UbiE
VGQRLTPGQAAVGTPPRTPHALTRWLFEGGAGFYGWMTAQRPWRESCRVLLQAIPATANPLHILDLGCGAGECALELARGRPRDSVTGVDMAWRMLRRARRLAAASGLDRTRVRWIRADGARLPLRANSVDAITAHSVLYLLDDRPAVLRECLRVLRPGGGLVVMEPSDRRVALRDVVAISGDPRFLLSVALWRPISWMYGRFAPESLEATLGAAGFAQCEVSEALAGLGLCARALKA